MQIDVSGGSGVRNGIMGSSLLETGNLECMLSVMVKISHEEKTEGKMEKIIDRASFQRY